MFYQRLDKEERVSLSKFVIVSFCRINCFLALLYLEDIQGSNRRCLTLYGYLVWILFGLSLEIDRFVIRNYVIARETKVCSLVASLTPA